MCTDYLNNNVNFECSSENSSNSYQIGEQLSCEDIEQDFSSCYPLCANAFSLSDFEGKVFWLMYEEDWWTSCYTELPEVEEKMLEYINNPNVVIINVLSDDANAMWTCEEWGAHGIDGFPIIIDDYKWLHT